MEEDHQYNSDFQVEGKKKKMKEKEKHKKKRKSLDVKMEVIQGHPDKISPLVGYFPSGYDPQTHSVNEDEDEDEDDDDGSSLPRVRVFRNTNQPKRLQLVVSPKDCKVDFVGGTHFGEAVTSQVCTYALGVLDKDTQTLKILPIASNKILRLEPRIVGSDFQDKELSEKSKEECLTDEQIADKRREGINKLTKDYGSKKQIARDITQEALNRKIDPNSRKELDNKLQNVQMNKEAVESAVTDNGRNIPFFDTTATEPAKAYPIDRIIDKAELDYLLDILNLLEAGNEINLNAYPSFVSSRIHKLVEIEDDLERRKLACIFSYITHLIKFKDQQSADYAPSAKDHKIPGIIRKKFMTMFVDTTKYSLSPEKINLIMSHVLVLTLHADGFRTDPSDIAKDLRISGMSLREHYKNLGCKLCRDGKPTFFMLPVPLQFPKPKMDRRKRR